MRIADAELAKLADRMKREKSLTLKFPDGLAQELISDLKLQDQKTDARRVKAQISKQVERELVERVLSAETAKGKVLRFKAKNGPRPEEETPCTER